MTIADAISRIDTLKPNAYADEDKIHWLAKLDGQIYEEVFKTHEDNPLESFSGYNNDTDIETTELLVPAPYDDIYPLWLETRIDYSNGEYNKYNVSITMFNTEYRSFTNYYNRTHKPVSKAKFRYF